MRKQLSTIEQRFAVDAVKKRGTLDGEISSLAEAITQIQEALTTEVKDRVGNAHILSREAAAHTQEATLELKEWIEDLDHFYEDKLLSVEKVLRTYEESVNALNKYLPTSFEDEEVVTREATTTVGDDEEDTSHVVSVLLSDGSPLEEEEHHPTFKSTLVVAKRLAAGTAHVVVRDYQSLFTTFAETT